MNTFLKYFFALSLIIFWPSILFAKTDASISSDNPAVGETIKIYVPNAVITAKIVDIVADDSVKVEPSQSLTENAKDYVQEKVGQVNLEKFAESNPVKTGIQNLENAVNDQVAKWYQLAMGKKDAAVPALPASVKNVATKENLIYAGLGILGAVILWWLFKKMRNRRQYEYASEEEEEE